MLARWQAAWAALVRGRAQRVPTRAAWTRAVVDRDDASGLPGRIPIHHVGPYADRNVLEVPPGANSILTGYRWGSPNQVPGHNFNGTFHGFTPVGVPRLEDETGGKAPLVPIPTTPQPVGVVYTESLPVQRLRAPRAGE